MRCIRRGRNGGDIPKYIIMCGGTYRKWSTPRQLLEVAGEPIVARTIRLLKEAGVDDIAISSNLTGFDCFEVPVLKHQNDFEGYVEKGGGSWVEAFYPMSDPACYIMGDVVFSPDAIMKIVNTQTTDVQFFASAPPFDKRYIKQWAERRE